MRNSDWKKQEKQWRRSLDFLVQQDSNEIDSFSRDLSPEVDRYVRKRTESKKFQPWFLDEIRARVSLSDLWVHIFGLSENPADRHYLKKSGDEYVTYSPFKDERSPSMKMNNKKGHFHDFSSGEHGSIFSLLLKLILPGHTRSMTYREAIIYLANLAKLPVPKKYETQDEYFRRIHKK